MLFYLFCMFDDFWRINHRSQNSAGKNTVKTPYLRRSTIDEKHPEALILPDDEGSQERRPRWGSTGSHHVVAWTLLRARRHMVWEPWPTLAGAPSLTSSPENPKTWRTIHEKFCRLHEAETREREKLSGREKSAREIPSRRGEIISIVTVIKL